MVFVDEYPPVYREPEVFPEADVQGGAVASFDDAVFHGVLGIKKSRQEGAGRNAIFLLNLWL